MRPRLRDPAWVPRPALGTAGWRPVVGAALIAASLFGCSPGGPDTRVVTRDSAGITIVENRDEPAPAHWTVAPDPLLAIGADDAERGFGLIAGVLRLGNGTIAAADALARQIRFFDGEGGEVRVAGRRGEGPGEFETIVRIWPVGSDSLGVWDARLLRYTVVTPVGRIGAIVGLEGTAERARHTPVGLLSDGRLIVESDARVIHGLDYYRADISLMAFDADGTVADTLATVPGVEMWDWVWEMGTTPSMIPFGRTTSIGVQDDAVYVAANEGYQIDRYDGDGNLVLRVRLDREPAALPASRIAEYQAAERARAFSSVASKGGNEIFGRLAEAAPYPEHYPYYEGLLIDDVGNMWVRETRTEPDAPTRFTVFAPDGTLTGMAEFQAPFTPTQIARGFATGIWRDELDVEHVRVYRVTAPAFTR